MESKPLTLQDVFDKNWQYFIVDNNPFGYNGITCVYLGSNGEKCAIGVCIPEEIAKQIAHPTTRIAYLLTLDENLKNIFHKDIDHFALGELQTIHDGCAKQCGDSPKHSKNYIDTHDLYKQHLIEFAERHNLKIPS